jgi:hypothetical protein
MGRLDSTELAVMKGNINIGLRACNMMDFLIRPHNLAFK